MEKFLSCDWGTSTFRLRLISVPEGKVITEEDNDNGSAKTFELWQQSGKPENERFNFYLAAIIENIKVIEQKSKLSLAGIPIIVSGMASSSIGMLEVPYKELPFSLDGTDLKTEIIEPNNDFLHKIVIISGAKTEDDVMRGEETKLIGFDFEPDAEEQLLVLPGTHPKHVYIKNGGVIKFTTFMTGEFFNLLTSESILAASVEKGDGFEKKANYKAFSKGVLDGVKLNLLHNTFLVRTNFLFKKYTKQENFNYLSGVLIGNELKELISLSVPITLLGGDVLSKLYSTAFETLNITLTRTLDADEALIKGQMKIYNNLLS